VAALFHFWITEHQNISNLVETTMDLNYFENKFGDLYPRFIAVLLLNWENMCLHGAQKSLSIMYKSLEVLSILDNRSDQNNFLRSFQSIFLERTHKFDYHILSFKSHIYPQITFQ
jgi:hypothetical protein